MKTDVTYKKEILEKYKRGDSDYLKELSPAKIRRDCLLKYEEGLVKKDELKFYAFFNLEEEGSTRDNIRRIKEIDIDRFRPFKNFLIGKTSDTLHDNIELIAILINFEPRPLNNYRNSESVGAIDHVFDEQDQFELSNKSIDIKESRSIHKTLLVEDVKKEDKAKFKKEILVAGFGITAVVVFILITNFSKLKPAVTVHTQKCMIWKNDRYKIASCHQLISSKTCNAPIAYNEVKFNHFKKIEVSAAYPFFSETNQPQVWYQKKGKYEVEFFSAPGIHPLTCKTLKPVTAYIVEKYVPVHNISDSSLESLVR
ncbi:hypothetical protein [Aquimarina agarilytica]|uniref:hypothetical protein n=1 Tax=Aquimarina agarilytica TaxID=1087449 RepID=UPI000287E942|nr:hypothetical protein [Aquimarina agarilytica]